MASTPQTLGFRASVMPTFQGADPRLFNSYGALATGLQSGVDMASRLQEVRLRREQQARLAEQAAYEQTQRAGLEETRRLQNAAAKKALETVVYDGPITYEPQTQAMFGEDGNAMLNPNGTPMLENIAGSNVKVESGRNPVTGVMEYRRTEANPIEIDKFVLEQTDRENRSQLERDRFELEQQKVADGRKIIAGAGVYDTANNTYTAFPNYQAVPRQRSVTDMMALKFMGIEDPDQATLPAGTGTILVNPRAAAQSIAVNPLDQPASLAPDSRFTNIFNAAQPALVQPPPPPPPPPAKIAAAAKIVADAAAVAAAPIIASVAEYNKLPSGSFYRKPGETSTRKKP